MFKNNHYKNKPIVIPKTDDKHNFKNDNQILIIKIIKISEI